MSMYRILFYAFSAVASISCIGILITRNIFYGALLLLTCLLSVAGIYVLAFAEFVAVTQILIYAGGVLVVIIFGIMLTAKISGKPLSVKNSKWGAGIITGCSFLILLIYYFSQATFIKRIAQQDRYALNSINRIGTELMSDFVLPFEIAGILLLVALIGAAVMASYNKKNL